MTIAEYRCVVAHMLYWKRGLTEALADARVTCDREDVINQLWGCGYTYDPVTDSLAYEDEAAGEDA